MAFELSNLKNVISAFLLIFMLFKKYYIIHYPRLKLYLGTSRQYELCVCVTADLVYATRTYTSNHSCDSRRTVQFKLDWAQK